MLSLDSVKLGKTTLNQKQQNQWNSFDAKHSHFEHWNPSISIKHWLEQVF